MAYRLFRRTKKLLVKESQKLLVVQGSQANITIPNKDDESIDFLNQQINNALLKVESEQNIQEKS